MKKMTRLSLVIALALVQTMFAQTKTFDIATFVPPKGWTQTESNGILIIQDRSTNRGRAEFCQIFLFPSQPSNATPEANFQTAWEANVARTFGITVRPSPQTQTTPDGWTALIALADFVWQRVPMRAILVTTTGFGRSVSVLVTVSPNAYQTELDNFFRDLNYHADRGGQNPVSQPAQAGSSETSGGPNLGPDSPAAGSLANYVYTVPAGWGRQESPDRIVLMSPAFGIETCQLTMLPLRPLSRPLAEEALGTFREIFRTDPLTTYPSPPPKLAGGTSPFGWDFFTIKKLVGGQEGEARTMGTILLAAKVDGQVATIVRTSKDFMVSNCFGLLKNDAWPKFFYSLRFRNARPSVQETAAIRQRLAGTWIMATGNMGLRYEFRANGRYADAAATMYRSAISSTEVLQTTTGFFGNGSYSLDGNTIVMTRDDHQRSTFFFRVQQASNDSGQTWKDELCLLTPGSSGEVCYHKE